MDNRVERVMVRPAEPLLRELTHFRDVALGIVPPLVGLHEARRALELAWRVAAALDEGEDG
jgi:hypothetical protein